MRDRALDGLRGVAALAVLWSHLVVHLQLAPVPPLGGMGVLVFFVLSGYLIARIVARRGAYRGAYLGFLHRRAVRLAPVAVALAVCSLGLVATVEQADPALAALQGFWVVTQTTAFATTAGLPVHPIVAPAWSLTVEWTFYILFPAWYLWRLRAGRTELQLARQTAVGAALLYLCGLLLPPLAFYHLPVANLGVMVLGAALGLAHHAGWVGPERLRTGIWPVGGAAVIAIFVFLPGYPLGPGYEFSVLPATALSSALVINGCVGGHPLRRWLSNPVLAAIGLRAYSLYLWHMTVLWLTWRFVGTHSWTVALLACLALVPIVELSYRLLEAPVLRRGSNALR